MESKELDELREKLKYTYIDYGMALVVSGHKLDEYLDEALKIIGSHVTAEVERAKRQAHIDEVAHLHDSPIGRTRLVENYVKARYQTLEEQL